MSTMMTMAAATTTVGALPRCSMRLGISSRPPLKGTRQHFAPRGLRRPPHWDQDRLGGGGVRMPTTGPDDHCNPNGVKIKEGIEGGEEGPLDFKRALYVAQIATTMLPRGQQRKGVDQRGRVVLTAGLTTTTACTCGSMPGCCHHCMLPSLDEFHHLGSAFVCYPFWTSFTIWDHVGECAKNARGKGRQNKSPCCVLWADETQALSREKMRQGPTPRHANTSFEGIQKQNHMAKPRRQKIHKIREKCSCGQKMSEEQG
jgi:hypothetical protein